MNAKKQIFKLQDQTGKIQSDQRKILDIATEWRMFTSVQPKQPTE